MDSHPVVTPANLGANLYIARDLTVDFDGVTRKYDVLFSDDILRPASVAGIELHSHATGYADDLVGDQVFSGPYTDPTFSPQTFYLTDEYSGLPETLTISAAPEPSMWALMFAGLSGVGLTLRRSRKGMAANLVAL